LPPRYKFPDGNVLEKTNGFIEKDEDDSKGNKNRREGTEE